MMEDTGQKEVELMYKIPDHNNVVKLLDHINVGDGFATTSYLVMDLAASDLFDFVTKVIVIENEQNKHPQILK